MSSRERKGIVPVSSIFILCVFAVLALAGGAFAQTAGKEEIQVKQIRGVDSRVDYASLVRFGPWDDRNYQLTQRDLELLAPDEEEIRMAVPAFFRVQMRRAMLRTPNGEGALYPHAAVLIFRQMYGGYLYEGKLYRKTDVVDGRYKVLLNGGVDREAFDSDPGIREKFLNGEVRVTNPTGAAESAIKINPVDSDIVIAGTNGPGSGQKMHYSSDGGATWNSSAALPLGGTCCDPTIDYSSDGTLAYTSTLGSCGFSGCQIWFYRSSDNGQTWDDLPSDRRTLSTGSSNDKEFIHVDKYSTSPYKDNIYATWHSSNVMQFARSTDFGDTWSSISFSTASDQRGIGSDITTDKGGDVYYIWPAFNSQRILLRKSTDGGATLGAVTEIASTEGSFAFPVPSMESREVFMYASADTDFSNGPYGDSIYVAWTDSTGPTSSAANNHARIQVAYSRNGGSTWTVTTPHETADQNSVDRYHQWLAVGDDGTVHVIFYDTRRSGSRTAVDVFYSYSTDGAQTWSTPSRVTAEQSPNIADGFEFGDYNGLDIVGQDMIAIFTDNRVEGGGSGDSVDVYAAGITPGSGGGGNNPPNASFTFGCTNLACNFTDTSTDSDGSVVSWSWNFGDGATSTSQNPSHTYASAGTYTVSLTVTDNQSATDNTSQPVSVTAPGGGGGPQTALFDSGLQAPECSNVGSSCDSVALLDGRNGKGPEPNAPNTIFDSCTDGTSGSYHSDESIDRIVVSTLDGTDFAPGKTVEIETTVWAWNTGSADRLDLYYAANANSPSWTYIGTFTPPGGGARTMTATYTLPTGSLQAVRANFRYQGSVSSCSTGSYDDHDDLVFAVGAGVPNNPPTANFNSSCTDLDCNFTDTSTDSDGSVVSWSWNFGDGSSSTSQNPSHSYASAGTYNVTLTVTDNQGATDDITQPVTVTAPANGGPQNALFNVGLQAPACTTVGISCDSGSLLDGRNGKGPEPNAPNTIADSCIDGTSGSYHNDESIDQITVETLDGNDFAVGKTVRIEVTVWAWSTGSSDRLDLYYAANASSPSWVYIGTITPPGGGAQTLSANYTLPSGSLQAVRANFRYNGSVSSCSSGNYDDHDDLVFAVSP